MSKMKMKFYDKAANAVGAVIALFAYTVIIPLGTLVIWLDSRSDPVGPAVGWFDSWQLSRDIVRS